MQLRGNDNTRLWVFAAAFLLAGCGGSSGIDTTAGDTTAGDTTAGDTTAGDTTAGDTTDGNSTAGDTTAGDTTAGNTAGNGVAISDVSGTVSQWGYVDIHYKSASNETDMSAGFLNMGQAFDANLLVQSFNEELDNCEVTSKEVNIDDDFDLPDGVGSFTTVSAGEIIPFTSPTGTFVELQRVTQFGFTAYTPSLQDSTVSAAPPSGLSFDIPGDVFPAFANIPVPELAALNVTSPTVATPVTASTTFTWNGNGSSDSYVHISANALDKKVDCLARDDGSFTFPASTQAELGSAFTAIFSNLYRQSTNVHQQGGAVLFVIVKSE